MTEARRPPAQPVRVDADGLVLRGYRATDAPALHAAFEDADVLRWNPPSRGLELDAWWRRRADWSDGTHVSWAVVDPADDRLLGDVSLHEVDLVQGDAAIGYTVLPAARGRGVARRAVEAAVRYAFDDLGLFRIRLMHAAGNVASCNVALAAGFVHEGTLRQSHRYGDGERHDEHVHGRLATD